MATLLPIWTLAITSAHGHVTAGQELNIEVEAKEFTQIR